MSYSEKRSAVSLVSSAESCSLIGIERMDDELGTRNDLERIRQKLGIVWLNWPSIEFHDDYLNQVPLDYSRLSDAEKVLHWHVENFRKQYHALYPLRKPLLLICANECSIQRFVSSAIRCSVLPYAELSTWQGCATFIRDFLSYEPLADPLLMVSDHSYSYPSLSLYRCSHNY
ncbi:PREDICTED: coiled-coil domain-containing protein lobo homolog [Ceratosolen solmsi marchali]|uniref:Coiled-coil domain-containing protein lobo homolog n=1 Tax=Ceratosolen solmsi marchali TaxID=326594 RepID=A0AAJ6YTA4_9HYME|nr:PREDICTED: coiled-coil domain-containing protein lobo homolog [Ceratosolen solmsi marchali]